MNCLKWIVAVFLFISISNSALAQLKEEYRKEWTTIESLEKKGLTQSALAQTKVIFQKAVSANNEAQQIKAVIYQLKYNQLIKEESSENNLLFIDTFIAKAKAPAKNILQNLQAEMYWRYLQNNRYKLYSRTKLLAENSKDISTWSINKLHATISQLYLASLKEEKLLQVTPVSDFDALLIKGENTSSLRPTIFDFLAFRALDYFTNDESDITRPAYQFVINDSAAFAPAAQFINASFITKDTVSIHHKAVLLLQRILQFHLNDSNPQALLDADLIRLQFVSQFAVNNNKTALYESALEVLAKKYANYPEAAQAIYLRAQIYYDRGQQFLPLLDTKYQYELKRAKALCDSAVQQFPKSEGGINAQNLLQSILRPNLGLQTEQVNIPGQAFRTLVQYKNAPVVYLRIIPTTKAALQKMERQEYAPSWKTIASMLPTKSWKVGLPNVEDYQNHSTEIKIDALTNGLYFILASLDENFSQQKNILVKQLVYVSNISCVHNNNNDYYVLDRDNGQPLNNASVQVWETKYNYNNGINESIKAGLYYTDKNGLFHLPKSTTYQNIQFQIKYGTDELFLDHPNYAQYYDGFEQQPTAKPITVLFTDRTVYRPGQTVYFKGIVLQKENDAAQSNVVSGYTSKLQLMDVNNQQVNELNVTTNAFGSYHGSFQLPTNALNGQFSLFDSSTQSSQYFSVEEYKCPKFYVELQQPNKTYRLGDSVQITGTAKAFAGNAIDGAAVKYSVVRKVILPIWKMDNYRLFQPKILPPGRQANEVAIAQGELITDAQGAFTIPFKALPDLSIEPSTDPTFYYEINTDVTDLNGETRTGNASVAVAYRMLQLEIKVPELLSSDSLKSIFIQSTNLNNIEEKTTTTLTIHALKSPNKIFRQRYWPQPDQFVMRRDEFYSQFPYDVYSNENEVAHFATGDIVFEKTDSTNRAWAINAKQWTGGWYHIVATSKDRYGATVKAEKFIQLFNENATAPITAPINLSVKKDSLEPGEKFDYNIKTGFNSIWLIQTLTKSDNIPTTSYQNIRSDKPYKNEILIAEKDRGGIDINYLFVQHNQVYKGNEAISIPWSNKALNITYATFRDKLLPGSDEKWQVKISGEKGEKASAEMLVSMYDASLDQFKLHRWNAFDFWPKLGQSIVWTEMGFEANQGQVNNLIGQTTTSNPKKMYDQLLSFYEDYRGRAINVMMNSEVRAKGARMEMLDSKMPEMAAAKFDKKAAIQEADKADAFPTTPLSVKNQSIPIRKNFQETAFFFPDLQTDSLGNVSFSFTMPEALTQWKLMSFAHTKTLASAYSEKTIVTQKPLMIQANAPRFVREGDRIEFSAKLVNLSDKEITGTTQLALLDAATNQSVDGWFKNIFPSQYFTIAAGQSAAITFPIEIPFNFNSTLTYRIVATANNSSGEKKETFSDGEAMSLPVLTNRILVTESMPMILRNETSKTFSFKKLLHSASSSTIVHQGLTVEYSSNPVWYAVQALPYLMKQDNECTEQLFNRYYANVLATHICSSIPKIKAVMEQWRHLDTVALLSNLQKNEAIKSILLQETPWIMEAQNENQQKKNIALLLDVVNMASENSTAMQQLKAQQSPDGGFVWLKGGPDDRYMTQYILCGIGHLKRLHALPENSSPQLNELINKAIPYLDQQIQKEYEALIKSKLDLNKNHLSPTAIQYLYMRSFFTEIGRAGATQKSYTYYLEQAKKYWLSNGKYLQAMIALALHRTNAKASSKAIIRSLKENAINNEEMGMYWKEWTNGGYYWQQAPIESQALMIEAFAEIDNHPQVTNDLTTWLLKQKQTQNWKTTKATAEACYALLLHSSEALATEKQVTVQLGNTTFKNDSAEAGTGYFKKNVEAKNVQAQMGNIAVSIISNQPQATAPSWGSVYWQYFEDLDKITPAATPLQLTKKIYVEKASESGLVLKPIVEGDEIKLGDKIKVRIELKVDRDMEYVHLKDLRAACMEPVNVISQYKWQGGLGYYESSKDASTNFFFGWLPRGSYVFEYPLWVTHSGNFSNGIANIQSLYTPEFSSHSEGIRINVAP